MAEPLTLYKLIILYMLKKVDFPLTNAQITDFMLDRDYTTYFTLQQAFSELLESELIRVETIRNTSQYRLKESGAKTLDYFSYMISKPIQEDIDTYLSEHKMQLRNEVSVLADYYKGNGNEFIVHCWVKEKENELIDLKLAVPLEEQAKAMCANWPKKCQGIYAYLMEELM